MGHFPVRYVTNYQRVKHKLVPQFVKAKLVNITPITWVHGRYLYI